MPKIQKGTRRPFVCAVACPSTVRYLPWLRRLVPAAAKASGCRLPAAAIWRCTVALIEAVNNAMEHAHRRQAHRLVRIALCCGAAGIRMAVRDQGRPFTLSGRDVPSPSRRRGRGLYIMRTLMHRVRCRRCRDGNELVLEYRR
ncbi:MAG: ATP-binding protein [Deltaproteobacteria bacterium]|nr:ATP-binding protein [Deltaproteobacteria bacterium]